MSLQSTKLSLTGKQEIILKADWDLLFRNFVPLKVYGVERGRVEEGLKNRERLNCVTLLGHVGRTDI